MTALKTLLADPTQPIAFVAELTYRDPDTDTTSTKRITTPNWEGTESGYLRGLLTNPGTREVSIEADELGGIASELLNTLEFKNEPPSIGEDGPLDFLRDKSLAGRAITLLAGSPTEAIGNYEEVGSGVADGEPTFDDEQRIMQVRRKSALERLEQDLDVNSYVGEPSALKGLTSSGSPKASTASTAAFNLSRYTIACRVRGSSIASSQAVTRRQISASDRNWRFAWTSSGEIENAWTVGGVAQKLSGSTALDDGEWHVIVVGVGGSAITSYLMVDGAIEDTLTAPGQADTGTTHVEILTTVDPWSICDLRIFNHYITPDEMRAAMAVRASGNENGLVGLWRGDDNTGSTLTDYSSTGADATISGTEDTDFEWVSSDLGSAELAGKSMPVVIGGVIYFPADLVDSFRERWRVSDRDFDAATGSSNSAVYDEGEELTAVTDYTWSSVSPIIEMASEAGEPLTARWINEAGDLVTAPDNNLTKIMTDGAGLVTGMGPIASADLDASRLAAIYQASSGLWTRRRPSREIASEYVRGMLGFLSARRDGELAADALVPPTAPSPRDGACLEFSASPTTFGRVRWTSLGGLLSSGDFSVATWFKSHRWGPSWQPTGSQNRITLIETGGFDDLRLHLNLGTGIPQFEAERFSGGSLATQRVFPFGDIFQNPESEWFFVALVNDETSGSANLYVARDGSSLALVGSTSSLGYSTNTPQASINVGQDSLRNDGVFRGSIFETQIWDSTLSLSELQDLMDAAPSGNEADLAFFAPLNGDSSVALTDTVSDEGGTISGDVQEVPTLVLDLRETPRPFQERRMRPAKRIEVRYRRNYAPLGPEEIAATVPDGSSSPFVNERLDRQKEHRSELWESAAVAEDFLDARDIEIDSHWTDITGAQATLRIARYRFSSSRRFAVLGRNAEAPNRKATILEPNDEVRIYGYGHLSGGLVYRVVGLSADLDTLDAELRLLR